MNTIFDDCKKCDTADEKVNYLASFIIDRLNTPRNDFYSKPHYTSSEACKYLQISKKTLDNICSDREIAYTMPRGRRMFLREHLEEYIRRNSQRSKYKPILKHYELY